MQDTEPTNLIILKSFHWTKVINTSGFPLFTVFDLLWFSCGFFFSLQSTNLCASYNMHLTSLHISEITGIIRCSMYQCRNAMHLSYSIKVKCNWRFIGYFLNKYLQDYCRWTPYQYNPKHLYPKLNGYGDNGQRSLKLWQLLHTYWLPNTY